MMRDMTKGAPLGHLFLYAVPLLLGNWLQLAYNAVDSIIAGRFIGQDALAAEGAVSYTHLDVYKRQPKTPACAMSRSAATSAGGSCRSASIVAT